MPKAAKKTMPMVALDGMVIIPGMIVQFDITNRASLVSSIESSMRRDRLVCITVRKDTAEDVTIDNIGPIGVVCKVREITKLPGNVVRIHVEALDRAEITDIDDSDGQYMAEVKIIKKPKNITVLKADDEVKTREEIEEVAELMAMVRLLRDMFISYSKSNPKAAKTIERRFSEVNNISDLIDQVAGSMPLIPADRERILNAVDVKERFMILSAILTREIEVDSIKRDLSASVKAKVDKNQRDYVLREQLKIIRKELGDDTSVSDVDRFNEELSKIKAEDDVREKIKKEIDRFSRLPSEGSESSVQRVYIETLLEMPWDKVSKDSKNLDRAEKILNRDHYGLDKVKERVLEFLAVRTLTEKGDSPIICLVGPPGTGKTSIARSVAEALNKKYVRISLGGIRDEAEIRGHRRTYVGAMPGRIAAGMKSAGVKNPLMLLDEIDKVSSDYKGDTSSALLEVLDSEQNVKFRDHYIEIPIDLSEVLFIATANDINNIPRPLLDRMEIIEVTSYTENEKFHIAKEHLIKKQFKANGIKPASLKIDDAALKCIIEHYTREAGVRGLERVISRICRKAAREILKDGKSKVKVTEKNLADYLGTQKYHFDPANEKDEIGIVRGLAWTSVGGDTLQIEVNAMPGKGEIMLTGQLGDVMKESARAGISYIRSIADSYNISADYFKDNDFHIHIPQGSVPKDGPSAGITMATAVFSVITGKPVRASVAMTGEITLRGRVLPIGGLKEKLLAASAAGIKTVLVPCKNKPDVEEIDDEIKGGLEIIFVETMDEVIANAIVNA